MADPYKRDRRLGRWLVSSDLLQDCRFDVPLSALQSSVIILETRFDLMRNVVEFTGRSPVFEIVEAGSLIPAYEPVFRKVGSTVTVQWRPAAVDLPPVALSRAVIPWRG